MKEHVRAFVETAAEAFDLKGPVYEFGFCPSGELPDEAALRSCFPETGYVGCELGPAAQVDRLSDLARLPFPDAAARTVICTDTLEHVFEPQRVVEEMIRILMPGGVLLLSASVDGGTPSAMDNYWRLTPHAVQRLLNPLEVGIIGWQGAEQAPHTVYGIGGKPPVSATFVRGVSRLLERFPRRLEGLRAAIGWSARLREQLLGWVRSKAERQQRRDFARTQFVVHLPVEEGFSRGLLLACLPKEPTGTRFDGSL